MSYSPGFNDSNGKEVQLNDLLKFEFKDLLDTPFSNSNIGRLIVENSIDEFYVHIQNAKDAYPEGRWFNTVYYFIYFVKNGKLFTSKIAKDSDYVLADDDKHFYTSECAPDFLRYLISYRRFVFCTNIEKRTLTIEDFQS